MWSFLTNNKKSPVDLIKQPATKAWVDKGNEIKYFRVVYFKETKKPTYEEVYHLLSVIGSVVDVYNFDNSLLQVFEIAAFEFYELDCKKFSQQSIDYELLDSVRSAFSYIRDKPVYDVPNALENVAEGSLSLLWSNLNSMVWRTEDNSFVFRKNTTIRRLKWRNSKLVLMIVLFPITILLSLLYSPIYLYCQYALIEERRLNKRKQMLGHIDDLKSKSTFANKMIPIDKMLKVVNPSNNFFKYIKVNSTLEQLVRDIESNLSELNYLMIISKTLLKLFIVQNYGFDNEQLINDIVISGKAAYYLNDADAIQSAIIDIQSKIEIEILNLSDRVNQESTYVFWFESIRTSIPVFVAIIPVLYKLYSD